jgi:hypothetical protein
MLAFIAVVNEGEKEMIERTATCNKLTWLQEWLLYFEVVWGRSCGRWVDMEDTYGYTDKTVRNVFDQKKYCDYSGKAMAKICKF